MIGDILPDILVECGIDNTSPQITENTFEMRQIKSLLNAAGVDINARVEWSRAANEFTATGSNVDLPDDFDRMAAFSLSGIEYFGGKQVTDPALWQLLEKQPSSEQYYHLRNGKIYFSPAVTGATVRYVSKNWLGTKAAVTANADEAIFPERLLTRSVVWRWRRQKGLPYDDQLAEFEADLSAAEKADK